MDGESTICGMSPNTGNRSPCARMIYSRDINHYGSAWNLREIENCCTPATATKYSNFQKSRIPTGTQTNNPSHQSS